MGETSEIIGSGALANVTDMLNKLAGPALEECGAMLGDTVRVYRLRNLLKTAEKTKRILLEAGVTPKAVPSRLLLPILDNCSVEDDDGLQERWARLLATASQGTEDMSPSYIETLKQLTPSEARHIDYVYKELTTLFNRDPTGHSPIPSHAFSEVWHSPDGAADTFERLGLVYRHYEAKMVNRGKSIVNSTEETVEMSLTSIESAILDLEADIEVEYRFTVYGVAFYRACQGPQRIS